MREEFLAEVERLVFLEVDEDLGVEHIDAGIDGVAKDLAPAGLFEELLDVALSSVMMTPYSSGLATWASVSVAIALVVVDGIR